MASSTAWGPVTAAKMNRLGIRTGLDLRAQSLDFLAGHFGKGSALLPRRGTWPRRATGRGRSGTQVRWSGEHLRPRPDAMGRGRPGAAAGVRQSVGCLWPRRACRADGDGEGQIRRFPADHPQPIRYAPSCLARGVGTDQPGAAAAVFPATRGIRLLGVTISNLTVDAPETRSLLDFMLDTAAEAFDAGPAPDHVA